MKRSTVFIDPALFDSGAVGLSTAKRDSYFGNLPEDVVRMVMDNFVKQLPEPKKSAVEMCVMSQITYEEAARNIAVMRGLPTDKKTVWRWAHAGLEDLKEWLIDSPWVSAITEGKIPVDMLDPAMPIGLSPWEENNG